MKKKILLVKILIGLVIVQLLALSLIIGVEWYQNSSDEKECATNRGLINQKVQTFITDKSQSYLRETNFPESLTELEEDYNIGEIKCPSGGTYVWNPLIGTITCDIQKHND